jgi:glutamate---cysteine ligase / carboxylate-amine ligase
VTPGSIPDWAHWRPAPEPFTVGLEEEVMLIDPLDGMLVHDFDSIRPQLGDELARRLTPETHGASVELESDPSTSVAVAGGQLARLRAEMADELAALEIGVAAAGTHPIATWTETEISEGERYRYLHMTMRELARREPTHALHVHVGVDDPDEATEVANRMRTHLPVLLALSANSPFWQGRDSGLASARTPIFGAFPRVGIPRRFADYRDYFETLELMIEAGAFPEPTFVWWDLRLQPCYGTIEIRVMDAQTQSWRTTALAALAQCAVRLEALEGFADARLVASGEILEENRFLAFRDGVAGVQLDPRAKQPVPVTTVARDLLEACAPHARELGCERELADVERIIAEPGDAVQRQIAGEPPDLDRLVMALREAFAPAAAAPAERG